MTQTAYTPRQRMLAAYQGQFSDYVPVAPEFWYYIPAKVMGMSMIDFELQVPHWQALQITFNHYQCEGWGIVAPAIPPGAAGSQKVEDRWLENGRLERLITLRAGSHLLTSRTIFDPHEPSWLVERFIKDFEKDMPVYEQMTLLPPEQFEWKPVQQALDAVGEDYLLEVYVGSPFVDYVGNQREGALEQVILDLVSDHTTYLEGLLERYIDHIVQKTKAVFQYTSARAIFISSSWSTLSLLSPSVWRKWEKPVLQAVTQAAHQCGGLVHHHFHGKCMKVLPELAALGMDCICPFERPPGGDVTDLPAVRDLLGERTAFNGNVHTVETLINGTPQQVREQVLEILQAFQGSPRLIIGTGDQVGGETPEENIRAMIETARQFGKRG